MTESETTSYEDVDFHTTANFGKTLYLSICVLVANKRLLSLCRKEAKDENRNQGVLFSFKKKRAHIYIYEYIKSSGLKAKIRRYSVFFEEFYFFRFFSNWVFFSFPSSGDTCDHNRLAYAFFTIMNF